MTVEFHPAAVAEARAARARYEAESPQAAAAFVEELELAAALIDEAPSRWGAYVHGTQRYVMRRFPFSVVYRARGDVVTVVAVAHHRRSPGYWRRRRR